MKMQKIFENMGIKLGLKKYLYFLLVIMVAGSCWDSGNGEVSSNNVCEVHEGYDAACDQCIAMKDGYKSEVGQDISTRNQVATYNAIRRQFKLSDIKVLKHGESKKSLEEWFVHDRSIQKIRNAITSAINWLKGIKQKDIDDINKSIVALNPNDGLDHIALAGTPAQQAGIDLANRIADLDLLPNIDDHRLNDHRLCALLGVGVPDFSVTNNVTRNRGGLAPSVATAINGVYVTPHCFTHFPEYYRPQFRSEEITSFFDLGLLPEFIPILNALTNYLNINRNALEARAKNTRNDLNIAVHLPGVANIDNCSILKENQNDNSKNGLNVRFRFHGNVGGAPYSTYVLIPVEIVRTDPVVGGGNVFMHFRIRSIHPNNTNVNNPVVGGAVAPVNYLPANILRVINIDRAGLLSLDTALIDREQNALDGLIRQRAALTKIANDSIACNIQQRAAAVAALGCIDDATAALA